MNNLSVSQNEACQNFFERKDKNMKYISSDFYF